MKPINLYWFERLGFDKLAPVERELLNFLDQNIIEQSYAKGEIITFPGNKLGKIGFIRFGLVKGYYKIEDVNVVNWISSKNEVIAPAQVFLNQPDIEYIVAIEPTVVDYLPFTAIEKASEKFTSFRLLRIKLMEEYFRFAEARAMLARIPNASVRIRFFKQHMYRPYFERAPKKDLASYLGITPETFSRIYHNVKVGDDDIMNTPFFSGL
jgi:CRP-like cAMP-binding protein